MTQSPSHGFEGRNGASFRTFVYRIARNALIDFTRRRQREGQIDQGCCAAQPPPSTEQIDHAIAIAQLLPQLTGHEQRVVHLLRTGYQQREIAQMLELTHSNVTRLKQRAIARGRELLGHEQLGAPVRPDNEPDPEGKRR